MNPKVFHKLSYGMYLVSSLEGERLNGQIANTVFQITSEPATIAVSINKNNYTHQCIESSKKIAVSILSEATPQELIGTFGFRSGKETDKFSSVSYKKGLNGCPILTEYTVGFLEAEVIQSVDVGTHSLFICKVTESDLSSTDEPMTYAYYHKVKRGSAPASAPTFVAADPAEPSKGGSSPSDETPSVGNAKYRCAVCGYLYDPAEGDEQGHVPPGTPFEKLPEGWTCPICGAPKTEFEMEN